MTGEEEVLYGLCFELHKTPAEILEQCSTVDLLRLESLMQRRWNEHTKEDWYAAQQAFEIFAIPFRVWGKKVPDGVSVKSFLMKFKEPERPKQHLDDFDDEAKLRDAKAYVELQKQYWFAAVGLDPSDPAGKNDGIPVRTQLAPDMRPEGRDSAADVVSANVATVHPAPAAVGFTPRGKGKKRNR